MTQQEMFPAPGGIVDWGQLQGASGGRKLEVVGDAVYASKCFIPQRPYTLASEAVCADLAILLDLPIPAYRRLSFQGKLWFSLEWRPDGRDFRPGMEEELTNIDAVPAMFAFDVLICNGDRNRNNIVFQKVSPALERYRFQLIDHSHALGGDKPTKDAFVQGIQTPERYLQYWPELRSTVTSVKQFEPFLIAVENLDVSELDRIVSEVPSEWRPNPDDISYLPQFLIQRAAQLRHLISQAATQFPNLV